MSDVFAAGADARRDELRVDVVTAALQNALTGSRNAGASAVVWSDRGSQIVLHVGKLQLRALQNTIVVAVDTESAEFGVAPLIVRFVFGGRQDPASLVAATDEGALGHPAIAARWGTLFRDVIWAALVRLLVSHADSHGLAPASVEIGPDRFLFGARQEVSVRELAEQHHRARPTEVPEGDEG
ncbi:hypothetical protein [Kribbella sp. NPDC051620]|uniref:hypothetical protein n=1 Tax=Kribbella sp. NPDC051620 TaxID=3364120 RepID=UPI0037ACFAA6